MSIESFFFGIVLGLAAGIAIAIPATAFFFKEMVRWSLKYAARYKAALDILCRQYGEAVDCVDCQYSCSCRLVPKDGEQSKNLCGEIIKRVTDAMTDEPLDECKRCERWEKNDSLYKALFEDGE